LSRRAEQDEFDVVIVGSGAGGGMAAYALTRSGARVCVLEAGGPWDNATDGAMMRWPYETERRGGWIPTRHFGEFDACIGGWSLEGEPYTRAPGTNFSWWRARMVGGRTNHWGRISLRFGPDDFRRGDLDGLSPNWPVSYDDVRPYYDRLDRLIGLIGSVENLPNQPDGIFLPPPRPRAYELLVMDASRRMNIPCVPARLSIITRPHNGRQACHYCGQCNRGCSVHANFSSTNVLLPPARATGRLTLRTGAMVREVTVDARGRCTGVNYIDKDSGADRHLRAGIVVLAASACESVRIMLNSKSAAFPQGLANGGGHLGKWLTDTTGTDVAGFIPRLAGRTRYNEDGVGGGHVYMPWWGDHRRLDFPRGYHIEVWGGYHQPGAGFMGGIHRYPGVNGYGAALKADYRRLFGTTIGFSGRGEMIPNEHSYCELDPEARDRWNIPVLRFHWRWTDHEYHQVRHMQQTFRALVEEMGGQVFSAMPGREQGYGIAAGGTIIHELGGARMGASGRDSVLNGWCQAHEVPNLFVVDGAPFVSQADKNPTWTIMALAWRASDRIAELRRRREL
jgi:choline dehydrogenase-like flavoprotein